MKNKKSSLGNFYSNAHEYIPVCCHFDERTLLTKDGELIQTIQINGINQENISSNLLTLREIIRKSLKEHINSTDLACWIHTIRKKENLDDDTPYPNMFSQNVHNIWVRKNYWNDKFVNTLFISFVYKGIDLKITNLPSFLNSFRKNTIAEENFTYLEDARAKLDKIVSSVTEDLSEFGVKRLGITLDGDDVYCEITALFRGVLRFVEIPVKIEESDLSKIIGSFDYAVGSNKIEVISEHERKYASILSIKEYQDISTKALDRLLQQPTEFVITEIFHFVPEWEVKNRIKYQDYILSVSNDTDLEKQKGITQLKEIGSKYSTPFCFQQISVLVMDENMENLEKSISNASFQLAKVGLVHVLEDVNIENAFWAQIPSNFKHLRRLKPNCLDNVGSMASLHNFPAGNHRNAWGRAATILRSERGAPYFFNFHDKAGDGKALIIGNSKSGKTVIANFLLSETLKYDGAMLFITYADDSQVFIKANEGRWISSPYKLDPFKIKPISDNEIFIREFLRAMAGETHTPLTTEETASLEKLIEYFLKAPSEKRSFIQIAEFPFEGEGGQSLRSKMKEYLPGGEYYEYFIDDGTWDPSLVQGISFENFTNAVFTKHNYPSEDRFLNEYEKKFTKFAIFRELLLYANLLKYVDHHRDMRRIIKVENFNTLCTASLKLEFYLAYFKIMSENNNIYVNSIQFSTEVPFFDSELWQKMQEYFPTKIYLPAEATNSIWQEKLHLSDNEYMKLKSLVVASRLFMVKQDALTITCETSLGGLPGIIKMISADKAVLEAFNKIIAEKGENVENWLIEFYDSIR